MSEPWRSVNRIHCDLCGATYRETEFETKQHKKSDRHQGAIEKSIRRTQQDKTKKEREAQKAKDEVARVNAIANGKPAPPARPKPTFNATSNGGGARSESDKMRQMKELAAMGVAVPKQYQKDMAVAGDWEAVSKKVVTKPIAPPVAGANGVKTEVNGIKEEGEDDVKREDEDVGVEESYGVRKRRNSEDLGWGRRKKVARYDDGDTDIARLLGGDAKDDSPDGKEEEIVKTETKDSNDAEGQQDGDVVPPTLIKKESSEEKAAPEISTAETKETSPVPIVFKKRKGKKAGG